MSRISHKDWAISEEIKKRKRRVGIRFPIFVRKVCAACGDALRLERVWKVGYGEYKIICQQCASTWEEAYDKAEDPKNNKIVYSSSY